MKKELLEKAKACRSAAELLAFAEENGCSMTAEEAAATFAELNNSGELSDDELTAASGGSCTSAPVEVGARFQLESGCRCPCGHEYATVIGTDDRPMHGGSITWYRFECDACKNIFSMTGWHGTKL